MCPMIPMYENKYFTQIYPDWESFYEDYKNCGLPAPLREDSIKTLFYLLYAKYGNNPIANSDENQFKYKMFSIIFQHGKTWEKRLDILENVYDLSVYDAQVGYTNITNHAFNPETSPSTQDIEELNYINDQNVSKSLKSTANAVNDIWYAARTDASNIFLNEFKKLFLTVVRPQHTYIFETYEDDLEV